MSVTNGRAALQEKRHGTARYPKMAADPEEGGHGLVRRAAFGSGLLQNQTRLNPETCRKLSNVRVFKFPRTNNGV